MNRLVPDHACVVLGLVTTKTGGLEDEDGLAARVDAAARFIDRERLALGTQRGFATSVRGNALTIEDERRRLELILRVAERTLGRI